MKAQGRALAILLSYMSIIQGAGRARGDELLPPPPVAAPGSADLPSSPRAPEVRPPETARVTLTLQGPQGAIRYQADERGGVSIFDIREPEAPRPLGRFGLTLGRPVVGLEQRGQYLIVRLAGGTSALYAIHNPIHPAKLQQVDVDPRDPPPNRASAGRLGPNLIIAGLILIPSSAPFFVIGGLAATGHLGESSSYDTPYSRGLGNVVGGIVIGIGVAASVTGMALLATGLSRQAAAQRRRGSGDN